MKIRSLIPDRFTLLLISVVALATVLPAQGYAALALDGLSKLAIGILFFFHGAKLSRQAVYAGLTHWRLQVLILLLTFALFPLLGIALKPVILPLLSSELYTGFLFLCVLPATVQSAIAFTSMAKGNIAAAVCSASASSIIGIWLTPVLVNALVVPHQSIISYDAIFTIVAQILLPFVLGQILHPYIIKWIDRYRPIIAMTDQGTILLIVYVSFSAAVLNNIWYQVSLTHLVLLLIICCILLAVVLLLNTLLARYLGFSKEDEITIVFCGSKKSMASGVPMANVLFSAQTVGIMVLPLMIFHQIQLMVCAYLAKNYAKRVVED